MIDRQGNQDFTPIERSASESCTLHLPQIGEPVSVQNFLDRLMQYQVDPALLGRQICQILATNFDREILLQIANTLGAACQADFCLVAAVAEQKVVNPNACWQNKSDRPNAANATDSTPTPENWQTTGLQSPSISLEHPVLAKVLADGEIVAVSDYLDSQAASPPNSAVPPLPCRAILAGSTRFGGAVNGIMIVGKSQPHEWSAADRKRLEAASDAIGIAISHIQKTQEIASLNEQLQREAKYKNLLGAVAAAIDTSSEIDLILQQVIKNTVDSLEVDRGQILLLKYTDPLLKTTSSPNQKPKAKVELVCESALKKDANKQTIAESDVGKKSTNAKTKNKEKTANSKSKIPNLKPINSPAFWLSESSLCEKAFHSTPKPLALDDAGELISKEQEGATEILKLQGIRGLILVPLTGASRQETVLGFLVLQHSEPRTWSPEELEVLELVCAQASRAIIATQTLKEVQTLVQDRTAQLQQSLDVQGKLYEQSANQLEQLRKLKLIKDEFLSTLSHELRTPLTIMKLAIIMLKQAEQPSASRVKYLDILEQQCSKETALVNDLLALKQFELQQVPISLIKIDFKRLIQDLAGDFEKQWADKELTLKVDLPKFARLETDPDILKRVLLELLTNAGKYSASGTAVVFEASEAAGCIVLSVSNFGPGIAAADLPHIFDKFRRGTGITDQAIPGTGLGLALVKCLVEHLNGTIDVSSCPAESFEADELWRTSFTLTLPQFPAKLSNLEE